MVFSSVPVYLDPPNWQQQAANNHQGTSNTNNTENLQLPPLLPPPAAPGSSGSIRPSSMPDRARLAKLPQPEAALKCPRCESINTKFCYFNNYSLSQPRHFCKTCRRYWTRGGALRNVPVGGGCRRNKRSKSTGSSKSPVTAEHQAAAGSSSTSSSIPSSSGCASDIISHIAHHQSPQQLPFMANLHHLVHDYGAPDHHHHHHMGLNFGGIQQSAGGRPELDFQMGRNSSTGDGGANALSSGGAEQWRIHQVQQFPFLAGLEPPPGGLYPFEGEGVDLPGYVGQVRAGASGSVPMHGSLGPVKMEENQGLNLPRSFFGINVPGNDQYNLGGINAWTDLSGFTSSSASHLL